MSNANQPKTKKGDKVRLKDGTEGVVRAVMPDGTITVTTTKGVTITCDDDDFSIIKS